MCEEKQTAAGEPKETPERKNIAKHPQSESSRPKPAHVEEQPHKNIIPTTKRLTENFGKGMSITVLILLGISNIHFIYALAVYCWLEEYKMAMICLVAVIIISLSFYQQIKNVAEMFGKRFGFYSVAGRSDE